VWKVKYREDVEMLKINREEDSSSKAERIVELEGMMKQMEEQFEVQR
jgi:hypothetical protein